MTVVDMTTVLELLAEAGVDLVVPSRLPTHIHCPFHAEDTASCAVWADHWHCFGCGLGGSPVDFVAKCLHGSRSQAKRWLEHGVGEEIEWVTQTRREPEPIDLTDAFENEARNWGPTWLFAATGYVAEQWPHLGGEGGLEFLWAWAGVRVGRNALLIPHRDADGAIRGVKVRSLTNGSKSAFPGSTYPRLYRVREPHEATMAWLVEGESDTWTVTLLRPEDQVFGLPSGAQTWRPAYRDELLKFDYIWVALDNDETGDKAADKIIADLQQHATRGQEIRRIKVQGAKDWTEWRVQGEYRVAQA